MFCYLFLTFCGVDEFLSFYSLYLTSFLGWVLLGRGPFLLQSIPYPICGSVDTLGMPSRCSCHAIIWLMLAGPFLGLLYAFLLFNSNSKHYHWACTYAVLGFLDPFHRFWASLTHFIFLGILGLFHFLRHYRPISFHWVSLAHSSPSFSWAFAKSFELSDPNYHILYFRGLWAFPPTPSYLVPSFRLFQPILTCFPFLIMPMGLPFLSSGSFRPINFIWGPFAIF